MSEKTLSKYSVVFNEKSINWYKDKAYNLIFIRSLERHCNDLLRSKGYLFLRDVYESLGIKITKDSCVVGWIYEGDNKIGDNFVKFDIMENESSITIDFNVDGDILDRI